MYTKRLLDRLRLNGPRERGAPFTLNPPEKSAPRYITECCAYICSGRVFTMPILIDRAVEAAVYSSNRTVPGNESETAKSEEERGGGGGGNSFARRTLIAKGSLGEWKYIIVQFLLRAHPQGRVQSNSTRATQCHVITGIVNFVQPGTRVFRVLPMVNTSNSVSVTGFSVNQMKSSVAETERFP